jgi:hypothetical protein
MPMSSVDDLPADQRAVVSLLVRQGRSYAQVSTLLRIDEAAVRGRAQQALTGLGGGSPAGVSEVEAERIGDYLLGQLSEAERIETLAMLFDTASGRTWARRVADELRPLAATPLPDVPPDPAEPVRTAPARSRAAVETETEAPRRTRSRAATRNGHARPAEPELVAPEVAAPFEDEPAPARAPRRERPPREPRRAAAGEGRARRPRGVDRGVLVIAAAAVLAIAAIVVFAVSGGSSSAPAGPIPASAATATSSSTGSTTGSTGSTGSATGSTSSSSSPSVVGQVGMRATTSGSSAVGAVAIIASGNARQIAFSARNLPAPPASAHYVLWLYDSPQHFEGLGVVPSVSQGSVGPLAVALPADASGYHGVVLTLETSRAPRGPGQIVLRGSGNSPL